MINFIYYSIKNHFRKMDIKQSYRVYPTLKVFYETEIEPYLPEEEAFECVKRDHPELYHMWVTFERKHNGEGV